MNLRERILDVYRGENPDQIPFMLDLSHWFYHQIVAALAEAGAETVIAIPIPVSSLCPRAESGSTTWPPTWSVRQSPPSAGRGSWKRR